MVLVEPSEAGGRADLCVCVCVCVCVCAVTRAVCLFCFVCPSAIAIGVQYKGIPPS